MRIVYVVSKQAVTPGYVPFFEQAIQQRRVIRETPKGFRLCAIEAPADFKGFMYMTQHYHIFDSYAAACDEVARQCNETAAHFEARKLEAVRLMCEAHDAKRLDKPA